MFRDSSTLLMVYFFKYYAYFLCASSQQMIHYFSFYTVPFWTFLVYPSMRPCPQHHSKHAFFLHIFSFSGIAIAFLGRSLTAGTCNTLILKSSRSIRLSVLCSKQPIRGLRIGGKRGVRKHGLSQSPPVEIIGLKAAKEYFLKVG